MLRDLYVWKIIINIEGILDEIINYIKDCDGYKEDPFIYYFNEKRKFHHKHLRYLISKNKKFLNYLSKSQSFWRKKYLVMTKDFKI